MTAQVSYLQNALVVQGRHSLPVNAQSISSLAPKDWVNPYIAFLDGQPILRADWELVLEDDQHLMFIDVRAIPQGGGGNGNSDVVRVVAMIAVIYFTAGAGAGLMGLTAGTFGAAAANYAVTMVGMALVNALLPPPQATSPQQAQALAAPSPTYNMQAQGNSARLEAAIPEHFGRHIAYPDLASQPYYEFSSNEQYLYQLFCLGRGEYDIEAFRFEDTPVGNFNEVQIEVCGPNVAPTLFPTTVVNSIEVSGQIVTTAGYIGGFIANPPSTTANYFGVDFIMSKGLFYANDDGSLSSVDITVLVEARQINDAGVPLGGWGTYTGATYSPWSDWSVVAALGVNTAEEEFETRSGGGPAYAGGYDYFPPDPTYVHRTREWTGSGVFSGATATAQRRSIKFAVGTPGRYEVRVIRYDTEQTNSRWGHEIRWGGLRAYLVTSATYGDVTMIAMKARATNNLSTQASRKFNVIATRKIPTWNGSVWSANAATRSVAWPIAYVAKQCGLTDAQIDLTALIALDDGGAGRITYFDARFDNFLSFWETVTKIAQADRAKVFMQGGVLRVVRDEAATIPVVLYSNRNIVKNSFSIDYLMPTPETADSVNVGYFDEATWTPARVSSVLAGGTSLKPVKVDLFGITQRSHAHREGLYIAASNRYRRRIIKFQTEMEGFIPSWGDLIAIQHDMPGWGQGGEVTSVLIGFSNLLTYSEQLDNAAWSKLNATITANTVTTPGGKLADKLVENTATSTHYVYQTTAFSFTAGDTILFSALLKVAERNSVQFRLLAGGAIINTCLISADLLTGTVAGQQGGLMAASIVAESNGFYRATIEVIAGQAGQVNAAVVLCTTGYVNTYLGDGTSGLYVGELQVRKGTHNLVLTPQGCSGAGWNLNSCFTITSNTLAGPSGAVTADLIVKNATPTGNWAQLTYNATVGLGNNVGRSYKGSMWLWVPSGTTTVAIYISDANYNTMPGPSITLTTTPQLFEFTTSGPVGGWNPLGTLMGIGLAGVANTVSVYVGDVRLANTVQATPYVPTTSATISNATVLTLTEPLVFQSSGNHYIALRERDGSMDGPFLSTIGGNTNQVILSTTYPSFTPYTGGAEERTHFVFGVAETYRQPARVLSIKPVSEYVVEIEAINEDPSVHTADSGVTMPPLITSNLANYENAPRMVGLIARPAQYSQTKYTISWQPSAWANEYAVEQSADNGVSWDRLTTTGQSNYSFEMLGPSTLIRVAAIGLAMGNWEEITVSVPVPPPFNTFLVSVQPDGIRQFNFSYSTLFNQPFNWRGAEIRYVSGTVLSPNWDTMTPLLDTSTFYTHSPVETNFPLKGTWTFAAKSTDYFNRSSAMSVVSITLPDRSLGNVFDEFFEHAEGWLGVKTNCHVATGIIEANDSVTWTTVAATWTAWARWNTTPSTPIYYETAIRDFGTVITGQINSTVDADGTVVQELATSTNGSTWSGWSSAAAPFSTRYLKLRATVTATGLFPIPVIRSWEWEVSVDIKSEYLNDIVISGLLGSYRIGVGDIRIPLAGTYTLLKRTSVVIQDSSVGAWVATRIDQSLSPAPRWQFRLNGTLADPAFVDFFIEGY